MTNHAEVMPFKKAHDLVLYFGAMSDELHDLFGDAPPSKAPTQEITDWFEEREGSIRGLIANLVLRSGTSFDLAWVALGAGCEDCNFHAFAGVWGGQYSGSDNWHRVAEQHFNTDNVYDLLENNDQADQEVS